MRKGEWTMSTLSQVEPGESVAFVSAAAVMNAAHEFARVLRALSLQGEHNAARRRMLGEIPEVRALRMWVEQDDYLDVLDALARVGEIAQVAQAHVINDVVGAELEQAETRDDKKDARRTVCSEIGMILKKSPHATNTLVNTSERLVEQLPATLNALASGIISEDVARTIANETQCLTPDKAFALDYMIENDLERMSDVGTRRWREHVRSVIPALDPEGEAYRRCEARAERWVRMRPQPHGMAILSARVDASDAQAICHLLYEVASDEALERRNTARFAARESTAQGKLNEELLRMAASETGKPLPRDHADALTALLLEDHAHTTQRKVQIALVMDAPALITGDPDAAHAWIPEYGPITGTQAFHLLVKELDRDTELSVRRLFADPRSGELVAMDSRARAFPKGLATLLRLRDGTCRGPHCNAPISSIDHIERWASGGRTALANAQGLCLRCNLTKEAMAHVVRHPDGTVEYTSAHGTVRRSPPMCRRRRRSG